MVKPYGGPGHRPDGYQKDALPGPGGRLAFTLSKAHLSCNSLRSSSNCSISC